MKRRLITIVVAVLCLSACNDSEPYYRTCKDVPHVLHKGDPGYRVGLDRDKDGTACAG